MIGAPKLLDSLVRDDDVGDLHACHVEGLARRHAGDDLIRIGEELGHGRVRLAAADKIAVYLIGYYEHIVLEAYLGHSAQLVLGPDTSGGVMRVAENAERDLGIGGLALEILEVYLIVAVALGVDKVAGDVADVIMLSGMHEISVGRGEHEHLFVALAEVAHRARG